MIGVWALLFCVAQLALAYGNARQGVREAASARRTIEAEGFDGSEAEVRMDQARRSFHLAHRRSSSSVLAPLRVVPVLARQLCSFTELSGAASRIAGVATAGLESVRAGPPSLSAAGGQQRRDAGGVGDVPQHRDHRDGRGSVKTGPLRPAGELTLPGPGVTVEGDLGARWGWLQPGREWRNLATTPRFDVTAPLAARM